MKPKTWVALNQQPTFRRAAANVSDATLFQLRALRLHHEATGNAWFALEAIQLCDPPPDWATATVLPGLVKHLRHPDGDLRQQAGLVQRGSGKTSLHAKYLARKALSVSMIDFWKLVHQLGLSKSAAARVVLVSHKISLDVPP